MNRTTLTLLMAIVIGATGVTSRQARGDAAADLNAAIQELKKKPPQRKADLVDKKLEAAVAVPSELTPQQYQQARSIQNERGVARMKGKSAPEKRQALNQARLKLLAEIEQYYLDCIVVGVAGTRIPAYAAQLQTAAQITNSVQASKAEAEIVKALLADLDGRYMAEPDLTAKDKEGVLRSALSLSRQVKSGRRRQELSLGIYNRLLSLDTPTVRPLHLDRARLYASVGKVSQAVADYQAIVDDDIAKPDLKNAVRLERMRLLVGRGLRKESLPDAEALSRVAVNDASGPLFGLSVAVSAKQEALRVRFNSGVLEQEAYDAEVDRFCVEVLGAMGISAEDKSSRVAGMLLARARRLAGRHRWEEALAWARVAYEIAPNRMLPDTVTLIQQILANRSRRPINKDKFSVAKSRADLVAARAFYMRQSGRKILIVRTPTTQPAKNAKPSKRAKPSKPVERTIVLRANLSNDGQFPRMLADVPLPLTKEFKAGVEQVVAGHRDPLTRALACGLLRQPDKAIEIMGQAINTLGLESPKVSPYVNFTARFVRAKFESLALANAFLESQVHGDAGKDGKLGTGDDKPNPLIAAGQ